MTQHVFLIGGNHYDETWITSQDLIPGESIPIQTQRQPGGAAANMARVLMHEGLSCTFASVYGDDTLPPLTGPFITPIPGERSARYVSLEDQNGQVLHGFAGMAIYERQMSEAWYAALSRQAAKADCVVVDCNGPEGALAKVAGLPHMVALAVSPAKVRRLVPILDRLQLLFCNAAEAGVLGVDLAQVSQAVVTRGAEGAAIFAHGVEVAHFPAPRWTPASGNGLGDRLAGLTLARVLAGKRLDQALPEALEALPC